MAIYLIGADKPPAFVYAIYASIFAFFNVFAVNMVLQYRRVGRWREYLYGERVYMLLSLFAKSALAWRVFAGTLRPAFTRSESCGSADAGGQQKPPPLRSRDHETPCRDILWFLAYAR